MMCKITFNFEFNIQWYAIVSLQYIPEKIALLWEYGNKSRNISL
jgi:hypothetical protein